MANNPLLSIITITYQAGPFLERTLKSVAAGLGSQVNGEDVEYLIIDGGSTDETLSIAERYRPMVSKIVSERDKGLYDAMNKGLRLATGKYLWFLNAGDEAMDRHTLQNLLQAFQSNADVYYSDALMVREDGTEVGLRSRFTPHSLPRNLKWQDFALGMKVCHQAFIVKKSIAPLYDDENLSADIDWEISCLKKANNVRFVPFVICRYLLGGLSVKNHRRSLSDRFKVLTKHFGLVPTVFNHLRIFWRGYWFARQNGKYW